MKLKVNGQEFSFDSPLSLRELLKRLAVVSPSAAVAVNSEVVPRSELEHRFIRANDEIEILYPVGGG